MKKNEIERFIKFELQGRWDGWEPTPAQAHDLQVWLEQFTYAQAQTAASQIRYEDNYNKPNLGRIAELCKRMTQEKRSTTHVPAYAVFEDGMLKTFYFELMGLVDVTDAAGQKIKDALEYHLRAENHFANHGGFTVFVGENNYKLAVSLSEQNREEWLRQVA